MTKSKRLRPVVDMMDSREREAARALGEQLAQLTQKQRQLGELLAYRDEYSQRLRAAGGSGMGARQIEEFQRFLDRIGTAIDQQQQQVALAQRGYEEQRRRYFRSRQRAMAVDKVMSRYRQRERQTEQCKEQRESDERAQRMQTKLDGDDC